MLIVDQHPLNKSITVSILGVPNVGKSSFINYLLGFDLSAVTWRPQTTRNSFHCNLTIDHTEIILVDTPGIHSSSQEMNKRMNQEALDGSAGADLNLILIDVTRDPFIQFKSVVEKVGKELKETWIIFNKMDAIENSKDYPVDRIFDEFKKELPVLNRYIPTSAKKGENMHIVTGALCDQAPSSPHFYHDGSISNKNERFFVSEYIREQAFLILREELPYEMAVVVDEFKDFRNPKKGEKVPKIFATIQATIIVNKPSQRAIVVGKSGSVIKEIGVKSREKIESLVGGKVFLNLHVKVVPKWFKNNTYLQQIGLGRAEDSKRVWRKR